jgi:basic amino acid/polyamine antiporter, APA family
MARDERPFAPDQPSPLLRGRDAVAITVGIVVGAGIFRTPPLVASGVSSEAALLLVWAAGGLIALIGALCYGELAAAYREPGGDYAYLRRAFGHHVSFLYAWARLTVIQTGSIAVLAFVFGDYASTVAPLGPASPAIYAAGAVVMLSAANWLGLRTGARAQALLTLAEVAGLLALVAAGLIWAHDSASLAAPAQPSMSLGLVMVFVLLTFGGWNEAAYISAELKGGPRRLVGVLTLSLVLVTLLYLLANLAYFRALGLPGLAAAQAPAADVVRAAWGSSALPFIALAVAIAALTSANATIITGARSAFALGRDVPAFAFLGRWQGERGTPRNAILVQGVLALLLVALGAFARRGFETAVEYTAPVFWLFFLAVGVALFVLRRRDPDRPRPFRVPLYPLTPLIFCATNLYLLWSSLAYTGAGALLGVAVLALGAILLPFLKAKEEMP